MAQAPEVKLPAGFQLDEPTPEVTVKLDYGNGQNLPAGFELDKPQEQPDWYGSAITLAKHYLSSANPVPVALLKSIYDSKNFGLDTAYNIAGAQNDLFRQAKGAYDRGDYLTATRKTVEGLIPLLGPAISQAGDEMGAGHYAAGMGDTLGLASQPLVSAGVGKILSAGKVAIASKLNPLQKEAVAFADREGIPLDAATRTGNETARAVQNVASKQLGGAGVAADARGAQTAALARTAENLKNKVGPGLGDYTAETAGQSVRDAVQAQAEHYRQGANEAYTQLRDIESKPENLIDVSDTFTAKQKRATEAFNQMVDQSVTARLEQIRADVRAGSTEMTGRTKREFVNPDDPFDVGPVTGRFAGGFKKSFSELARVEAQPGDIAKAIERGKGRLFDEVQKAVRDAVLEHESGDIRTALRDMDLPVQSQNVRLPVDMRPVKESLQPLYNELQKQWPIAQQQSSQGLKALENILNGEDFLSASEADANLSAIKKLQREAKDARNLGLTTKAVRELDLAVRGAVTKAGPEAIAALERGRALTKEKYGALDLLDTLRKEPVQVFDQLTARRDTQLNLLRDVKRQAPAEMPKLGRAYLEGLFETATQEGGFGKTGTIANKWDALGPEAKRLMFGSEAQIKDLDNFFRIAKKISENPNPSGTASTLAAATGIGLLITHPVTGVSYVLGSNVLARALFNPRAAKALAEGLKLPIQATGAAKTANMAYLLKLAGDQGERVNQPQPVPAY